MTRDSLNTLELIDLALSDLTELRDKVQWLQAELDGRRRGGGGAGPVSTSTRSDPTATTVVGHVDDKPNPNDLKRSLHDVISGKIKATHRDMQWLVNKKLPGWLDRLTLIDEEARPSDANDDTGLGPAELDGGVSAYRGDTRVPAGRPDLHEALAAQQRRLARGEGYGVA